MDDCFSAGEWRKWLQAVRGRFWCRLDCGYLCIFAQPSIGNLGGALGSWFPPLANGDDHVSRNMAMGMDRADTCLCSAQESTRPLRRTAPRSHVLQYRATLSVRCDVALFSQ